MLLIDISPFGNNFGNSFSKSIWCQIACLKGILDPVCKVRLAFFAVIKFISVAIYVLGRRCSESDMQGIKSGK